MSARRRSRWSSLLLVGALLTLGALSLCFIVIWVIGRTPSATPLLDGQSIDELNRLKLIQELQQLKISNRRSGGLAGALVFVVPIVTAVTAVAGGLFAAFKLIEQRRQDYLNRVNQLVTEALTNLGDAAEPRRVAGATTLATLAGKGDNLMPDPFTVVTGQLRAHRRTPTVAAPLSRALERLLPDKVSEHPAAGRLTIWWHRHRPSAPRRKPYAHKLAPLPVLALDHLTAVHLDLHGLDLRGWDVDLAFSDLKRAQLQGVSFGELHGLELHLDNAVASGSRIRKGWLRKAHLTGAYLHRIRWNQVHLEGADLSNAQLQGAELQQAKFSGAKLRDTNFAGADIFQANFKGTPLKNFDTLTLKTLLDTRGRGWRGAYFDREVQQELDRLDRNREAARKQATG